MKRTLFLAPLGLALATPALAQPFQPRPTSPDQVMERAEHALDQVEATDAQRDTVRSIVYEAWPQFQALHEEAHALRDEIRALFSADQIDRSALELARTDLVDLFDRATYTAFGHLADLAETFSVEQREELRELREERRRAFRARFGLPAPE